MPTIRQKYQIPGVNQKTIQLELSDSSMDIKIIKPDAYGPHPVIILFMGMYGVNASLCSIARILAEEGFAVVVPNLYYNVSPNAPVEFDDALEVMQQVTDIALKQDMESIFELINTRRDMNERQMALMGHCLGGRLSLVAARHFSQNIRCVSCYYATGLDTQQLGGFSKMILPIQVVSAGQSLLSSESANNRLINELRQNNPFIDHKHFEMAPHNFLDARERNYDALLAAKALNDTLDFLVFNSTLV